MKKRSESTIKNWSKMIVVCLSPFRDDDPDTFGDDFEVGELVAKASRNNNLADLEASMAKEDDPSYDSNYVFVAAAEMRPCMNSFFVATAAEMQQCVDPYLV
jgi:hypothetical protein